jgi:CheY-like chemotaxis protein
VADTGIGMSDETLDGCSSRSTRAPTPSVAATAARAGLAICASWRCSWAERSAESTLGEGSAFTFICSAPATDLPVRTHVDTVLGGRGRVLVVEDSPANRLLAVHQLERLGYEPLVAPSGTDALELLAHDAVDAVLMDWQMPDLDGLETTRRLRVQEHGSGRRVPVIGVTASARTGDEEQCRAAGMDDFLPKPVLLADLDAMLHRWIVPAPGDVPADAAGPTLGPTSARAGELATAAGRGPHPERVGVGSVRGRATGWGRRGRPAEPSPLVDESVLRETGEDLGDPEIVDRLVTVFLEELPERRAQLLDAVAAGRDDDARRAAHTIRGAALMLGATRLATRCADLEHAGEAGVTDEPPGADELARLCDDTAAAFVAHLQRANESAGTP